MPEILHCHSPRCPATMCYAGIGKRAQYCPQHAAQRKLKQNGHWRDHHKPKYKVVNHTAHSHHVMLYRVISDPDPEAGYSRGAFLRQVTGKSGSLAAGVLTPGMVLERGGRRYVVEGASGAVQTLRAGDGSAVAAAA